MNKARLFSAGHTISQHTVQKYNHKSKMDISNNDESHDILQSRTKLTTNDRYQFNSGPSSSIEKRPITANPTANQILQRRKIMQSQGFKINSNSQHPHELNRGHQTTDIRNINKPSSGYFYYNNLDMSSNQPDNESFKLMFNNIDQSQPQYNKPFINSKNSKKRAGAGGHMTLFGKHPQIQRIKSSHVSSR